MISPSRAVQAGTIAPIPRPDAPPNRCPHPTRRPSTISPPSTTTTSREAPWGAFCDVPCGNASTPPSPPVSAFSRSAAVPVKTPCISPNAVVFVAGLEPSGAMVATAREKLHRAGLAERATFRIGGADDLGLQPDLPLADTTRAAPEFDGAFSNFGPLNCVADLAPVSRALAARVRPGGRALLCIMGPWVPWEWLWYLRRGQPRVALRRFRRGGVPWRGLTVRYPSVGRVRRVFAADWRSCGATAIGALVPPSYAEAWAIEHPKMLARLDRWERRFASSPILVRLADHFLLELERR